MGPQKVTRDHERGVTWNYREYQLLKEEEVKKVPQAKERGNRILSRTYEK